MPTTDPAQVQSLSQVLITLAPVLVGGVIAITGGVLGSILSHWMKTSSERKDRKRQKLEEIVALTFEVGHWLEKQRDYFWWGKEKVVGVSPIDSCKSLTSLYFPELKEPMLAFSNHAIDLNKWVITGGQNKTEAGAIRQEYIDSYTAVYKPFHQSHMAFVDKAAEVIRELT
ncbi:hypothetical protein [Limnobacter sp.]|uniref:hypothetical protein n=1 Tax=Limnobacter sp. TaxID=2003368 RepID=UPI003918C6B5